jgi:Ca2+/Na+ antiporter
MPKKNEDSKTKDLTVSDLYTQNWEHVRHVENERLSFTSMYFVVLGAMLAFLSKASPSPLFATILLGLMCFFSLIGALMSFRLKADIEAHGERLHRIARDSDLSRYFTFGAEDGWTTRIKLRTLFPIIYLVLTIILLVLTILVLICPDLLLTQVPPTP